MDYNDQIKNPLFVKPSLSTLNSNHKPHFASGFVDVEGNPVDPANGQPVSAPTRPPTQPGRVPNVPMPCDISVSTASVPGYICKGQLLFEDNFNGALEKGKIWTPEIMMPDEPVRGSSL